MEKYQEKPDLVVRLGGLGDVIMTLGLLKKLQEKKTVLFFTHENYRSLIDHLFLPNVKVIYTPYALNQSLSFLRKIKALAFNLRFLAFRSFEQVFICYQDKRYLSLLTFTFYERVKMLGVKRKKNYYLGEEILNMAAFSDFELPELMMEKAEKKDKRVALFPGGDPLKEVGKTLRMWPIENFVSLAKQLLERGYEVFICGSLFDQYVMEKFQHLNIESFFSSDLYHTLKFLRSAQFIITPDAGPFHLSHFTDAKIIPLFGPTVVKERVPKAIFENQVILPKPLFSLSCSPCYENCYQSSCKKALCMQLISPEAVLKVIDSVI